MKELTDKKLLARVYALGDKDAFIELYDRHASKIQRFLVFKLPSEQDVEDELNNVFLRAWTYTTDTQVDSFGGLLYKIARNRVADFYRSRPDQANVSITEEVIEIVGDSGAGVKEMEVMAEMRLLETSLAKIKKSYREVVVMHYIDKVPISEIAVALDKTENNVRVMLHRAIQSIKKVSSKED